MNKNKSNGLKFLLLLTAVVTFGAIEYGWEATVPILSMLFVLLAPSLILTDIYVSINGLKSQSIPKLAIKNGALVALLVLSYLMLDEEDRNLAIYLSVGFAVIVVLLARIFASKIFRNEDEA